MKLILSLSFSLCFVLTGMAQVSAAELRYSVDRSHTSLNFEVDHLAFATVTGRFDDFAGYFLIDEKTGALKAIHGTVKAKSINTNDKDRDRHLRSEDFFHVSKFPELGFVAENLNIRAGRERDVKVQLTMRGVTKPVEFEVKFRGMGRDPWGKEKAAFVAEAEVNREDFGLTWNKVLETGGLVVGKKVKITLNVEGDRVISDPVAEQKTKKSKQ